MILRITLAVALAVSSGSAAPIADHSSSEDVAERRWDREDSPKSATDGAYVRDLRVPGVYPMVRNGQPYNYHAVAGGIDTLLPSCQTHAMIRSDDRSNYFCPGRVNGEPTPLENVPEAVVYVFNREHIRGEISGLTPPSVDFHLQPEIYDWVWTGVPTIAYMLLGDTHATTTIDGDLPAQVEWSPAFHVVDFGVKGGVVKTTKLGAPYPNETITYTYEEPAHNVVPRVTTTWNAKVSVQGVTYHLDKVRETTTTYWRPINPRKPRIRLVNPDYNPHTQHNNEDNNNHDHP